MEFELRFEQSARPGCGSEKYELGILTTARIKLQIGADVGAHALVTSHAPGQAHQVLDFIRKILIVWRVTSVVEQCPAEAFKFCPEALQNPSSPVIVWYESDSTHVAVAECANSS